MTMGAIPDNIDTVDPASIDAAPVARAPTGERRLLLAIIELAIAQRDRRWWESSARHVGSARWICEQLDLDQGCMLARLAELWKMPPRAHVTHIATRARPDPIVTPTVADAGPAPAPRLTWDAVVKTDYLHPCGRRRASQRRAA